MVTVFSTIDKVAGDPQASASVEIEIVWDTTDGAVPKHVDTQTIIIGPFTEGADENGYWITSLVPNDEILPVDNAYRVTETVGDESVSYYIFVTDSATPSYWSQDVVIATPGWL